MKIQTRTGDDGYNGVSRAKFRSMKEEALESLGKLLPTYADLQPEYTSRIHMPDYRAFSDTWECSLYLPIRNEIGALLKQRPASDGDSLLYCAPGPHAPLLRGGAGTIADRFRVVTLVDIDAEALESAKQRLLVMGPPAMIDTASIDFSGPFGQRLCNTYLTALQSAKSGDDAAKFLAPAHSLVASIFRDTNRVLTELIAKVDSITSGQRYGCVVSEMIATFTGTVGWLAFRSALYQRFSGQAPVEELVACLGVATTLWQLYNEHFFAFHLDFLTKLTRPGGFTTLAFDTCKVYDRSELAPLSSLGGAALIPDIMGARRLRVARHATISWRDHPDGFEVSLYGIPVNDFQAHIHDVELYCVEAPAY
jgi:hypothetical protein